MRKKKYTVIDLFAGCGGLSLGLYQAGWNGVFAVEKNPCAFETLRYNRIEGKKHFFWPKWLPKEPLDILVVNKKYDKELIGLRGTIDLVAGGPPCQGFSMAGKRVADDIRNQLVFAYIEFISMVMPKMILFENVPAITSKRTEKDKGELIVDVLKKELKAAGYGNYIEVVLDSTKYGVPQKRNRFFILACRYPEWKLQPPKPGDSPLVTVSDALAGLPNVIANSEVEGTEYTDGHSDFEQLMRDDAFWHREDMTSQKILNHMPMKHRDCTLKRFALLNQGDSLKTLFERYQGAERERLQKERILPKKMFIKRNYRLINNEPSPTVTSHCLDEFVHPIYDRALTVRECARLQSFPDSYNFVGGPYIVPHIDRTVQDKYEQIGDAVPPLLAYAWGMQIKQIFENND